MPDKSRHLVEPTAAVHKLVEAGHSHREVGHTPVAGIRAAGNILAVADILVVGNIPAVADSTLVAVDIHAVGPVAMLQADSSVAADNIGRPVPLHLKYKDSRRCTSLLFSEFPRTHACYSLLAKCCEFNKTTTSVVESY
jgi:hypothetical protein